MMRSESRFETQYGERATGVGDLAFGDRTEHLLAVQAIVGRKWHPVILSYLVTDGPMGFSALKDRASGISSKMLSESLDDLESEGLVDRELLSDQPVRVEYSLTPRGESLEPLVTEMVRWGSEHAGELDDGTPDDAHEASADGPAGPARWRGR